MALRRHPDDRRDTQGPASRQSDRRVLPGDLGELVNERLRPRYESIWLVGGAALTRDFIRSKLADEIRLTIAPIILGGGTPFFDNIGREQELHLKDVTAYKNGFVELWYELRP